MKPEQANKILNEKDPYLREIWAARYTHVIRNPCLDTLTLFRKDDGYQKVIPTISLCERFTIKTAMLRNGEEYRWIADADGSCQRFREIIKPER